jgi:hypothetical protein
MKCLLCKKDCQCHVTDEDGNFELCKVDNNVAEYILDNNFKTVGYFFGKYAKVEICPYYKNT